MRDIYDPPPAAIPLETPKAEPLAWTFGDVLGLAILCILLVIAAVAAWRVEPTMVMLIVGGGTLVVLESWFTALGFLHRRPTTTLTGRWTIFLAALVPWLVGLGLAALLMLGLFVVSDWAS